ncbi:acetylcholine receptor subunit beta-like 1 [Saccostrea cucullata]|uniref:acetylcholine receptor subunit beta-like 1 n=1 Tax=Saccostrea cuccullata TaxID=36930 RepID=UPI002ED10D5B
MDYSFKGILLFYFCASFSTVTVNTSTLTVADPLYDQLFTNYKAKLLPKCSQGHKVDVFLGTALRQLMNVNEKDQVLKINIWLRLDECNCFNR